jgi:hypothetical protein
MLTKVLVRELAAPIARRIGTFGAGMLTSLGINSEQVNQLETAIVTAVLIIADLTVSHINRKGGK